jgi:hypothetical protein
MSKVDRTYLHPGRTVGVPQQRQPQAPITPPRQRGSAPPAGPQRYDVYGNPITTTLPVIVLQNTTYTSGRAIASMVVGLLSLAIGGPILGVPAMLLSIGADREIARSHGKIGGSASARIGFWTGLVGSLLGIYVFFLVLTYIGIALPVPTLE